MIRKFRLAGALALLSLMKPAVAQIPNGSIAYGPYNAVFLDTGTGLSKPLTAGDVLLDPGAQWSIYGWVRVAKPMVGNTVIAVVGNPDFAGSRGLGTQDGTLALYSGRDAVVRSDVALTPGSWHLVGATFSQAEAHLYADGTEIGHGVAAESALAPLLSLAPNSSSISEAVHFGGELSGLTLIRRALASSELAQLYKTPPDFGLLEFADGSNRWPVQTRGQAGMSAPQDPSTLPHSSAPLQAPVAQPVSPAKDGPGELGEWVLRSGWRLQAAPKVNATAETVSSTSYDAGGWMEAVVPGTVLTTMVARGLYPDPGYGLNNLAIPESLNKQDYWYRKEFSTSAISPSSNDRQNLTLTFAGINYAASVWLNGKHLGEIHGAFIRGSFDVTSVVKKSGMNVLAVRISPPPHPGIPHEQSIKGGPGENGGIMTLDGPTFAAAEGWDWIPGVRDRNSGIWQDVTLTASGAVSVGDVQVITTLPQHDASEADVEIAVPLSSKSRSPVRGDVHIAFDDVSVTRQVTVAGDEVRLEPSEYAQLRVKQPKLWWPNGYGEPALHTMKIWFTAGGRTLSEKQVRFGMREISYELSLLDAQGDLKRVEFSPSMTKGEKVVSQTHEALRQTELGWVASLYPGAENSRSLRALTDLKTAPYLVIRVNGVRIACKGGNWGMDDYRKRVSREHLEPFFRLHRDAHLNMIRNWMGQDTEEVFYDLADEYGLLVWNDFWDSTQNYNLEPGDPALFLANAKDTMLRFRNHPSIAVWCGRNEGVPPPIINEGLEKLARDLDGTRYYSASSNQVNLQNSGPYSYKQPSKFFTTLDRGFSVEVGTPSMSTLESFQNSIAPADQWPISDAWAYHDWHQSGNGDVAPFMQELVAEFGEPASLADFERKAQMLNYVDHRAIFEGFNAHLWAPNSGRLLWMTQPAWPSTMWQILSSDYDTQASFYGVKEAAEPVHVQMNLPDLHAAIVNNTGQPIAGATLQVHAVRRDGSTVFEHQETVSAAPQAVTPSYLVDVGLASAKDVVFIQMELKDAQGTLLSRNFYWYAADSETYRGMNSLPQVAVIARAVTQTNSGADAHVSVSLENTGGAVALAAKLTLLRAGDGERILPAYYSDNYVSLLPGEKRVVEISYPAGQANVPAAVAIRGWNIIAARTEVQAK